ncbi:MAG: ComEC/Rec2 family competence protein [Candidatus Magasanikbacteria bacterium]
MLYLYVSLLISFFFIIIYWKNKSFRFILFCILFATFGTWRYTISIPKDTEENILHYVGENVDLKGYVDGEPDVRTGGVNYIVKTKDLRLSAQGGSASGGKTEDYKSTNGNIYLKSTLYPRYEYGDKLEIKCSLEKPEQIEDFAYDKYLARYNVFVLCQNPEITKVSSGEGNVALRGIFTLKQVIAKRINILWHEPYASFMAGLLYGYRGGLGELQDLFSKTGVTHIVAISGYNITIIATILITMCVYMYIPRKKAFWIILVGILLFVIFAGASASVVRAGIMGVVTLLAKQVGRTSRIGNVLMLTATLMALQNPYILIYDAGFQLSFISTLGLVYLTPTIRGPFDKLPEVLGLKESLLSTLAAIIATLPLILFQFGRLSVVAPVVNVIILWIIPLIMIFGFFTVVISFIFKPVALVLSWLSWAGMEYIVRVVTFFAGLNFSSLDISFPWWVMVGLYGVMIYSVRVKSSKLKVIK